MADNIDVKDAAGNTKTMATKDLAGVHIPKSTPVDQAGVAAFGAAGTAAAPTMSIQGIAGMTAVSVTVSGTVTVGSHAVTNAGTFAVQVDSLIPGTGATALGKAEDAAHSSGDVGVMALSVRQNTAAALAGTDADYQPLITNSAGQLHVAGPITIVSGGVASGAFASGSIASGAIAAGAIAAGATSIAENEDVASADGDRGVKVLFKRLDTPANSSGTDGDYEQPQISGGRIWVSGIITAQVPGTGATNLGKAEDAAHSSGDTGVMSLAVRSNTAASTSGTDGDYQPLITNTTGHLWVDASGQTLTVGSHAVTNAGTFAVQVSSNIPGVAATSLGKAEDAAHTSGDTGVMSLAVRNNTAAALAGTDGDYIPLTTNTRGAMWIAIEDGAGGQVTAFSGGTQYTEDAASAADPVGGMLIGRRRDTLSGTEVSADGDNIAISATSRGELQVYVDPRAGSIAKAEDAAHVSSDVGVMALAVRNNTAAALAGADNDYIPLTTNTRGAMWIAIEDGAGGQVTAFSGGTQYTEDAASAADPVGGMLIGRRRDTLSAAEVSADGDNIAIGASSRGELQVYVDPRAGSIAKAEDAAHVTADVGVMSLAVRSNTAASTSGSDGDYQPLITNTTGHLWVDASGQSLTVGTVTTVTTVSNVATIGTSVTPGTAAANLGKAEDATHTSGDVGVMALAVRSNTAASTSGSDGDYQPLITNTTGHLWVDASGQTLTVGSHAVTNAGTFAVQATIAAGATSIAKAEDVASADADVGVPAMAVRKATPANSSGTDGDWEFLNVNNGLLQTQAGIIVTITQTITRPANTTTYAINDTLADTAATAGGDTVTNAARQSGGAGIILGVTVAFDEDAATPLQGEIFLFDTAVTNPGDNAAFVVSDAEARTIVGPPIPFVLVDIGNNGYAAVPNLNLPFVTVGSANLRSLIRVKNAYVPTTNSSVLTIRYTIFYAT